MVTRIPFLLFFISGFCGLLYQVIWLRLAFRSFGVITPVLSVLISIFMLGLAIGSWAGGKWITPLSRRTGVSAAYYYAGAEFLIGVGAFVVPLFFGFSEDYLLRLGEMDSAPYLVLSGALMGASILPWTILMGFTFPFMMSFIKGIRRTENTSFSFLYLANVVGAMFGTLATALVLIELLGFQKTLLVAGLSNFTVAAISIFLGLSYPSALPSYEEEPGEAPGLERRAGRRNPYLIVILFATGFTSIGLEVVWTRAFTPVLWTTVYAFASLLAVYLCATWIGSFVYRRDIARGKVRSTAELLGLLALSVFLPVIINDPRINEDKFILLATIFPVSAVLGYLTPKLIDEYSLGFPGKAGRAYAINIVGCILGPLFASYVLMPAIGSKNSMVLLGLPYVVFLFISMKELAGRLFFKVASASISVVFLLSSIFVNISYEDRFGFFDFSKEGVVRRDHTATTISYGTGMRKRLFVNGVGITTLTPITKMMAHWPLAHLSLKRKPESALVICFGMGTTYRSLMSWPINVTAVELVPGVRDSFGYYFADADELVRDPRGQIVIDDGRRFLRRTGEKFDVITIDPPPPVEAAGSSLLYSREFLELVKMRLNEGGILHHWIPGGETVVIEAVLRTLTDAFPYVRGYLSIENWGMHFLASMEPIGTPDVQTLLEAIPSRARADIVEWDPDTSIETVLSHMLYNSDESAGILRWLGTKNNVMITDDLPYNEYFLVRRIYKKLSS